MAASYDASVASTHRFQRSRRLRVEDTSINAVDSEWRDGLRNVLPEPQQEFLDRSMRELALDEQSYEGGHTFKSCRFGISLTNPLTAMLLFGFVAGAAVILYSAWTQAGSIPSTQLAGMSLPGIVLLLCLGGETAFPGVFELRLKGPGTTLTRKYIS